MSKDSPRTSVLRDNDLIQKGQDDLIRRGDALALCDQYPYVEGVKTALHDLPAAQPTVKPLAWRDDGTNGHETDHAFGFYEVYPSPEGDMLSRDGVDSGVFPTLEAAKAAAQADYEARILSALGMQPTVSPEQPVATTDVAALVDALDRTTSHGQRYEYSRVGHHLNEASWHVHLAGFKSRDDAEAFLAAALARVKSKEGFSNEKGVM